MSKQKHHRAARALALALAYTTAAGGLMSLAGAAHATPVTINYAGFFLDTIGTNTLGLAGGGSALGVPSTLFVGATTPDYYAGTVGTAFQNSAQIGTLGLSNVSGLEWTRRVLNPSAAQLTPLTVTFTNGGDSASFTSRSLAGLTSMPLVQGLTVTPGADPTHPTLSWTLPSGAGDVDAVLLVLYDNVNNVEIGNRVLLPAGTTSYTMTATAALGADLTLNIRLVDLADPALGLATANLVRESRSFVNYTATPVPEPATWALFAAGLLAVGKLARRRDGAGVADAGNGSA